MSKGRFIRAKRLYSGKVVVFAKKGLYWRKKGCIRSKWLCSCKTGSNRAKVVVIWQKCLYSRKVVVFGQGGSIPAIWLYSGENGFILAKWL